MFPIKDDNPHFLTPVVTYALIASNVGSWVWLQGLSTEPLLVSSVCELGLIPGELLRRAPLGAIVPLGDRSCVLDQGPAWTTLVTSMFMHGGWLHLMSCQRSRF